MKKTIACFLIILSILSVLSACSKKGGKEVPEKLENVSSGYTGDIKIEKGVKIQNLDIVIGKYIFTVNGLRYRFKDFEKTPKRTTQLGDYKMDLYVKDGTLQKCIVRQTNSVGRTVYSAIFTVEGKATDYYKYTHDEFGNIICRAHYDKDGKLESFLSVEYDQKTQKPTARYSYNADNTLKEAVKYTYDEKGKLESVAYYDAKGNLKKTA